MEELERELLSMLTRELGELRIIVCRSKLCSERGEMGSGRFLLGRDGSRGLEKREPGKRDRGKKANGEVCAKSCRTKRERSRNACLTSPKL